MHVDADQAAEVYMKAIELGDTRSVARLAGLYEDADQLEEAVELYEKAAGAGDAMGMAQYARLLEEGKGVEKDREAALRLYVQVWGVGCRIQLLHRNVQRFRGGIVLKARRLLYH